MAQIIINDFKMVNGRLSITRTLNTSEEGAILTIAGQLATHRYFEEITSIETERFLLEDITVYQESFGSDDFDILYSFVANKFEVKGGESHMNEQQIKKIESELYDTQGGYKNE